MTTATRPSGSRMRPPRPWIPGDRPEPVLPAWMYARRETDFPHRVLPPEREPAPYRPRHARRRRRRVFSEHLGLTLLGVLLAFALGGYAYLVATTATRCPLP